MKTISKTKKITTDLSMCYKYVTKPTPPSEFFQLGHFSWREHMRERCDCSESGSDGKIMMVGDAGLEPATPSL